MYVVGGCRLLTKGCSLLAVVHGWLMFMVGCCSWFTVVHGYEAFFIPTKCFIRKKLTFRRRKCLHA